MPFGDGKGKAYARSYRAGGSGHGRKSKLLTANDFRPSEASSHDEKFEATRVAHGIDEMMGFERYEAGPSRTGWLCNMHSTTVEDENVNGGKAGVDFYFIDDDGGSFKATLLYDPYFLIACRLGTENDVEEWCKRKFEGVVKGFTRLTKEDLQMPNHLLGYRRSFLQLSFWNVNDLLAVRRVIMPIAEKNKSKMNAMDTYAEVSSASAGFAIYDDEREQDLNQRQTSDASDLIVDIREYDVPYHVRVAIDRDIRIGKWYTVEAKHGAISMACNPERLKRADPVVLAYDIETTKLPLKFPDAVIDQIMMISYMIDGEGFLLTNREIVSEDISDFEYTPKPEYEGPFTIFNEPDERAVVERFFSHIKEAKPTVIATYNGDFFDWPFVEARASILGIDMYREIGFRKNSEGVYYSDYCVHMDCFSWVKRDSYLPQGSQGLKAVTQTKLGYHPDEVDPELMTQYAAEKPQVLSEYSVSDAVATYYLYMKYVHPFIFSLCTIIPLNPDDVLRKGTGTLCEMLLMVQAYQKEIVLPNKHHAPREAFWEGHLLESETYVGGHVESIEAGVFRSDIPVTFKIDGSAIDELVNDLDDALKFSITVEEKKRFEDVENYEEVKERLKEQLLALKTPKTREVKPVIYHLDVASMYPNIMTTNRLQPDSMIQESDCAACDFNRPGKTCDRRMPWSWRGEFLPAKRDEYKMIRQALNNEKFPPKWPNGPPRRFEDLSLDEQAALIKKRLQAYSQKIYHKIHDARTIEREAIICQRENPFYVDTVKDFRDRRYDFKGQQKVWKGKTEALKSAGAPAAEVDDAKKMIVLFDSLQLAHKVILNSFYGYVMRKGSRWYSMEMAGVTCLTGAHIIQMARQLVERIGRPLELDTDGIWCILPGSFPENFDFKMNGGKKLSISYPCVMLNHLVHARFTNHQYQELASPETFRYDTHSENTIFFEVDGPYRAMILPTSKEEDKNLKKRYAVFNHDGSLAELKGFEVKRRGELKLIKIFQTQIFKFFLEGTTLTECYEAVARVANRWLDVLYDKGRNLVDEELIDLICENRSMSKTLEEYGKQKSTSITTAKRLAEFLGEQMVKDKGLNCKYIIASRPKNASVTDRAIPVAIFSADPEIRRHFLKKWMKEDPGDMDPRTVLDWGYYLERLGSVIQKLITIPAALQKVANPVPRVAHPDWLQRRHNVRDDKFKQKKVTDHFARHPLEDITNLQNHHLLDPENLSSSPLTIAKAVASTQSGQKRKASEPAKPAAPLDPYAHLPKLPDPSENYSEWLQVSKQKWKIQRQARRRRRHLFGEGHGGAGDTLDRAFRHQAEAVYSGTWQLLQLRMSETPGEVVAFVLLDNKIHKLKIQVKREIFVNSKSSDVPNIPIDGCVAEVSNHSLPNGRPSKGLYKLVFPEEAFYTQADKIAALLNHPSIEGVYEYQLGLDTRAVLNLGNTCTLDARQAGVLGKGLDQGFDLSSLHRTASSQPYLSRHGLAYIYIYHIVSSSERQVFAVFSTLKSEAVILVLTKNKDNSGIPGLEKMYAEALCAYREQQTSMDDDSLVYQDSLTFKVHHTMTRRRAFAQVAESVRNLRKATSAPAQPQILVLQSSQRRTLLHEIPSLAQDFPILTLRTNIKDTHLPPLNWQPVAARRIITNYLAMHSWVSHHIDLARYGDVPVCNLERDDPRYLIDLAYARRLMAHHVVLWWSPKPRPDHAGFETDSLTSATEWVEMPSINQRGSYESVCIELEIKNLAINTILTSSIINDLEASDSQISLNPAVSNDDVDGEMGFIASDSAFSSAGVAVLKEMVKAWWVEACKGSLMADIMVQHLVRWISSPDSFLYDRALHYYVQMMSKKAFQQLIADFRRVGSLVIFADGERGRLLLQTSKREVGNAYAYAQYIVKSINAKPLFHFLGLEVKEYWDYLVWYDQYNYGGKGCAQVSEESQAQTLDTIMHWQMSDFLPVKFGEHFAEWVLKYISLMHSRKHPSTTSGSDSPPRATALPFISLTHSTEGQEKDVLTKPLSKPLRKFTAQLIKTQRQEQLHPELASDYLFPPPPPGSLASYTDPGLQFVKCLMSVIGLDPKTNLEALLLRRDLLALWEIREFSAEARWAGDGSERVLVRSVMCAECAGQEDVDLGRDAAFMPETRVTTDADGRESVTLRQRVWRCGACKAELDRVGIEERLVAQVLESVAKWQGQDIKCGKCGSVKINDFMEHCGCSGEWATSLRREDVVREWRVLESVGRAYGMRMLGDVVAEALGSV